jgi:hypothetical protein
MVDIILVISIPVLIAIIIVVSLYTFAYYMHPDEKPFKTAIFYKVCIIGCITIYWVQLLILPLDIGNFLLSQNFRKCQGGIRGEYGSSLGDTFWPKYRNAAADLPGFTIFL